MWLLIDNYDSFTHILADYIRQFHDDLIVIRNDMHSLEEIIEMHPERIIISPGPGKPEDAQLSLDLVDYYKNKIPILGVCLGHQVIGIYFGSKCVPSGAPMHGIVSQLKVKKNAKIFKEVTDFTIMHYHSLILKELSNDLEVLAVDEQEQIMIIQHKAFNIIGMQFHPESILTIDGKKMIENWVKYYQ